MQTGSLTAELDMVECVYLEDQDQGSLCTPYNEDDSGSLGFSEGSHAKQQGSSTLRQDTHGLLQPSALAAVGLPLATYGDGQALHRFCCLLCFVKKCHVLKWQPHRVVWWPGESCRTVQGRGKFPEVFDSYKDEACVLILHAGVWLPELSKSVLAHAPSAFSCRLLILKLFCTLMLLSPHQRECRPS